MSVTLAQAKQHAVVEHNDDDVLIQGYIDAARGHVTDHLRRDLDAEFPSGWPVQINQAVLMLVAHWYAHREAVSGTGEMGEIPLAVRALLAPHRDLS